MRLTPITLLLGLCCALPSLAQAACNPADITPAGVAKVIGAPRTYLRSCSNETASCRGRAYVLPGDTVLTGAAEGGYVCALFPSKSGDSVGLVLQGEITLQPQPAPPVATWVGTWRNGDDSITLRAKGAQLTASGNAYWPSANPPLKDRPGGPNLGEMSGTATPQGNRVVFAGKDADDCEVKLTLLPPFLAATDNLNCGGMNVTFTGIYRKR